MDTTSVAQRTTTTTRTERGVLLWQTARQGIERRTAHEWGVPSCSGDDVYLVNTKTLTCTCPDHPRAKEQGEKCKHVVAAMLTMHHRDELRALCRRERAR